MIVELAIAKKLLYKMESAILVNIKSALKIMDLIAKMKPSKLIISDR